MKKKSIIILFIIITMINAIIPITVHATSTKFFNDSITFSSEYISGSGDIMPHGVITPSNANESSSIPLIVWLHGAGEFGGGKDTCMGTYNSNLLPRVIMDSSLNNFSAYVLIPHSTGSWNSGTWNNSTALNNVSKLIENFIKEHKNVDTNNIIISGHSSGAIGAQHMAANMGQMSYSFSKLVIVSGYPSTGLENISIPTVGYFGTGESSSYTSSIPTLEAIIPVAAGHAGAPKAAYNLDENGDGCSDLIDWMFEGYRINTNVSNGDYVEETDDMDEAGDLFVDLAQLLCFIPDVVIETLQNMFVSRQSIYDETTEEYKILYSPGTIFSGNIPAFDINFIKPNTYISKDSKDETSVIASNTYSANRSGGVISSGSNVVYEGESVIGTSTTHTKGERWNSRSRSKIVRNIWI